MRPSGEHPSGATPSPDAKLALLESAEMVAEIGSWEWTPKTGELHWSDNAYRLLGLEPGAIAPSFELVLEMTHPDDRERQARQVERVRRGAGNQRFDYRIVRQDGEVRHLRSTPAVISERGRPKRILGVVQDVTDQRRAEGQIAAHVAVSEAIATWESFERGAENLLRTLGEALDCVAGALWVPEGEHLVARVFWRDSSLEVGSEFQGATNELRLRLGEGFPGAVWRAQEPRAVRILGELNGYVRVDEAHAAGLRGAFAFPVLKGGEVLGVVELYSREETEPSERILRSLTGIGHELGQFLARGRGDLGRSPLTRRETEVLQLAANGNSAAQIAELLTISRSTVKTHFEHIYSKLGVHDRVGAVAKAVRESLIQ